MNVPSLGQCHHHITDYFAFDFSFNYALLFVGAQEDLSTEVEEERKTKAFDTNSKSTILRDKYLKYGFVGPGVFGFEKDTGMVKRIGRWKSSAKPV